MSPTLFLGLPAVLFLAIWFGLRQRALKRQRALTRLLDLADAVETLLDRSQERMHSLQSVVGRIPADMGAVARASLESALPIRDAKRDVLQHRLWIQRYGASASQSELDAACAALARAREKLEQQLGNLESAGSELANATRAADEAALREPAALRRPPQNGTH
jgi:hypothetical protein